MANVIELNGKLYNAETGEPVDGSSKKKVGTKIAVGQFVDGVKANASPKPSKTAHHAKTTKNTPQTNARAKTHTKAHSPAPRATRNLHHSTTLHRQSVSRPQLSSTKAKAEAKAPTESIKPKHDASRLERATRIAKSSAINRFHKAVAPVSAINAAKVSQPAKAETTTNSEHTGKAKAAHHASAARIIHNHKNSTKKRRRLTNYLATAAVVFLLVGYVAYLNIPLISLKVAANQAGFAATLPGTPSGYKLSGPIAAKPGQVTISYKANTDDRRFSLIQQPSTWDSAAVLENYVSNHTQNYITYQDRGLTIYVFEGSNAAWVNAGKLYTVKASATSLTSDQLLDLAASM